MIANQTIRYAIVGCGMMGQEHLRNLKLLRDRKGYQIEVTAVIEPDKGMRERAVDLIEELALGTPKTYLSHSDLQANECDAVVVVSPNYTHHAVLKDVLKLGVAVLSEKPLCTTVPDCEEIVRLVDVRQQPFWVAMEYRYMPPTRRFIEEIHEGTIGKLQLLNIREHRFPFLPKVGDWNRFSRNTGGTLVEKCCHHFDLMRLITQSEPTRIYASGAMDVNHKDERYNGETPDIIDNALVIVDFQNGVRASLELCMFADGADPQEQLTAIGDKAKIEACIPGPARFWEGAQSEASLLLQPRAKDKVIRETIEVDADLAAAGDHHGSTYYQHEKFANALLNGGPIEVSALDGAVAVRMGAAAQESLKSGEAVQL